MYSASIELAGTASKTWTNIKVMESVSHFFAPDLNHDHDHDMTPCNPGMVIVTNGSF